jgi:hypothetical protein
VADGRRGTVVVLPNDLRLLALFAEFSADPRRLAEEIRRYFVA